MQMDCYLNFSCIFLLWRKKGLEGKTLNYIFKTSSQTLLWILWNLSMGIVESLKIVTIRFYFQATKPPVVWDTINREVDDLVQSLR